MQKLIDLVKKHPILTVAGGASISIISVIGIGYYFQDVKVGSPEFGMEDWGKELERVRMEFSKDMEFIQSSQFQSLPTTTRIQIIYSLASFLIERAYIKLTEEHKVERLGIFRSGNLEEYIKCLGKFGTQIQRLFDQALSVFESENGFGSGYCAKILEKDRNMSQKEIFKRNILNRTITDLRKRYKNVPQIKSQFKTLTKEEYINILKDQLKYAENSLPTFSNPMRANSVRSSMINDHIIDKYGFDIAYSNYLEFQDDEEVKDLLEKIQKTVLNLN